MQRATPIAIVVAGLCIALAIYFGLRASVPQAPAGTPQIVTQAEPDRAGSAPPAAAAQQTAAAQARAIADAGKAVEAARAGWSAKCWDTADATTRTPGKYVATLAFEADGRSVISGVTELRGQSDPNVAQCLRQVVVGLTIPAPGERVSVEIPFALP